MLETWYDGDVHQWIRTTVSRPVEHFGAKTFSGHSATVADSWEKNRPVARLLGFSRKRRDIVWQCDRDRALYRMTMFALPRAKVSMEDFTVHCCNAGGPAR
jgi:hypothetical protein